jgi:hypothetical protein
MSPTTGRPTFDEQVCEELRESFALVFLHHPEVRSLAVAIDYRAGLNDADVLHGVWQGAEGVVGTPSAIVGSVRQTVRLLGTMLDRAEKFQDHLQGRLVQLGKEIERRHEEVQRLDREIEDRRKTAPA